ncbi:MAG: hypothetical protein ABW049_10110, partial [Spongiibacteraceae bacterium]
MTLRKLALFCVLCCLPLTPLHAQLYAQLYSDTSTAVDAVADTADSPAAVDAKTAPAEVRFMNRPVATFRATISGTTAETRARRATELLQRLPRRELTLPIDILHVSIDNEPMAAIRLGDRLLFLLAPEDAAPGDKRDFDTQLIEVQAQLRAALTARNEFGRWP